MRGQGIAPQQGEDLVHRVMAAHILAHFRGGTVSREYGRGATSGLGKRLLALAKLIGQASNHSRMDLRRVRPDGGAEVIEPGAWRAVRTARRRWSRH